MEYSSLVLYCCSLLVLTSTQDLRSEWWSEWSEPSACSRSCGGGVQFQERECLADGQSECEGPSKIYTSCNIQDCDAYSEDFRAVQCTRYNDIPFNDQYYEWLPYYAGSNECELNCLAKGETFYYRHAAKVVDGTRCNRDTLDVCVDGICQPVGCDKKLGSGARHDKCQVCDGDGATCQTVVGNLQTDDLSYGYHDLLLIPASATSISVREHSPSNNYLALRTESGEYMLNGNWVIDLPKPRDIAGTRLEYTRDVYESGSAEHMTAPGPTSRAIMLSILKQPGSTSHILYEYSIPVHANNVNTREQYGWVSSEWGACSRSCAHGQQSREHHCVRSSDEARVSNELCDPSKAPETTHSCNTEPCQARWYVGVWQECSASCGVGLQVRTIFCEQALYGDTHSVTDPSKCTDAMPPRSQECDSGSQCPSWQAGPWSKCTHICGPGQQTREVQCRSSTDPIATQILPHERCDWEIKPESFKACDVQPCEGAEWVTSEWSGCYGTCEQGFETRQVVCSSKTGKIFDEALCDHARKPDASRSCAGDVECQLEARWYASQWGPCSAHCGEGIASRRVFCAEKHDSVNLRIVGEHSCDPDMKLTTQQSCTIADCTGIWYTGPWGKCSKPCDGGERQREAMCIHNGDLSDAALCGSLHTPAAFEDCNSDIPCNDEELIIDCKNTLYGCCPDGYNTAEGLDYFECPVKDVIPIGYCVESDFGCCLDGVSAATGPFLGGCPPYTCWNMVYGCCWDKQTPADGPDGEGCPPEVPCAETYFGCCEDGVTVAHGYLGEGCDVSCEFTEYGCCPDDITPAQGDYNEGCEIDVELEGSGELCVDTFYGCCFDGITLATGPDYEGCNELPLDCRHGRFGCCPDGIVSALGPHLEGCSGIASEESGCKLTAFGCCRDSITPMLDQHGAGCTPDVVEVEGCEDTPYGCCQDSSSIAQGPNHEGCHSLIGGCAGTQHGCCPDGETAADGPEHFGCNDVIVRAGCETTYFGCCPDGATPAEGFNLEGCENVTQTVPECDMTLYGCCPDGQSVAAGPHFDGCGADGDYVLSCRDSSYGCCPDGETSARGPHHSGCPIRINSGAVCGMAKELGPCTNHSVMWYFDISFGDCARFWYGGCDGNENRFTTRQECESRCKNPEGIDKCYLPKSIGACRASQKKYYYDPETEECESFMFGGCNGNANKFDDEQTCKDDCVVPQIPEVCAQPQTPGPCRGQFVRWFYDKNNGMCRQFIYGGCRGNDNRFESEQHCEQRCKENSTELCQLEKEPGPCQADDEWWYFSTVTLSCETFTYGGCQGNANRFASKSACEKACHELLQEEKDVCEQPKETGPCKAYYERWFYNKESAYCEQFVYGGCEGNGNQFGTEVECRQTCNAQERVDPCTLLNNIGAGTENLIKYFFDMNTGRCREFVYSGEGGNKNRFDTFEECVKICRDTQVTVPPDTSDKCTLPVESGPCRSNMERWYYDSYSDQCLEFVYGGCEGNRNRFMTQALCEQQCQGSVTAKPVVTTQMPKEEKEDICKLPQDTGNCLGYVPSWNYDFNSGTCKQFVYGGCHGNDNRFDTEEACLRRCHEGPDVSGIGLCNLESDAGPCKADIEQWYYDTEKGRCLPFAWGGCGGNNNRFSSEERCQAACPPQDVCGLEADVGPCRANIVRYAYDTILGRCEQFYFGGCRGNANRFLSMDTCQRVCGSQTTVDACLKSRDAGRCADYEALWYFDVLAQSCRRFWYGGCEGNDNRFSTQEACEDLCLNGGAVTQPLPTTTTTTTTTPPAPETEIPTTTEVTCNEVECRMHCQYGFAVDESGCTICECAHPCHSYECPANYECELEDVQCITDPCLPVPVCVPTPKPGECPELPSDDPSLCMYECDNDQDCDEDAKCCDTGCGKICASPGQPGCASSVFGCCPEGETAASGWEFKGCMEQEPVIGDHPLEVFVELGETVILPCSASGVPSPVINWYRNRRPLVQGVLARTTQHSDGSLEIRDVQHDDQNMYSCRAYNSLGADTRTFTLQVQEAPRLEFPSPSELAVQLGESLTLDCAVIGGKPTPTIEWYFSSHEIHKLLLESTETHTIVIESVTQRDSGTYTCVVNNGVGRPLKKIFTVSVEAPLTVEIAPHSTAYKTGEDLHLRCFTDPAYHDVIITWFKGSRELDYLENDRILTLENGHLEIMNLHKKDSGVYECKISRGGHAMVRATSIEVTKTETEKRKIPEDCEDQPFYADCKLIVEAQMCSHPYLGDFCCYSCHLAGMLKRR